MEKLPDLDQFVANWIAHHTKYLVEGETAGTLVHVNGIDPRQHGFRRVRYQPVHRKREDPSERDELNRLTGSAPLIAWEIMMKIVEATEDSTVLDGLMCPLDLLLTRHGITMIDSVEQRAVSDKRFRELMVRLRNDHPNLFDMVKREGSSTVYERITSL